MSNVPTTISLAVFEGFINKAGLKKIRHIQSHLAKMQEKKDGYDYYWELKSQIRVASGSEDKAAALNAFVENADKAKQKNFRPNSIGYTALREKYGITEKGGGKRLFWAYKQLAISFKPDVIVTSDGLTYAVRLYMKKDEIAQDRVPIILHLMHAACASSPAKIKVDGVALLDCRNAKAYFLMQPDELTSHLLTLEAEYWCSLEAALDKTHAMQQPKILQS